MPAIHHNIIQGEIYFGNDVNSVSTLLGSCVAIVIWHPKLKYGGMCHIVLPDHGNKVCSNKYATCAIAELVRQIKIHNTRTQDYTTHIYGGGDMFLQQVQNANTIGNRNILAAITLLVHYGFRVCNADTGGRCYRKIRLNIKTGKVIHQCVNVDESDVKVQIWK